MSFLEFLKFFFSDASRVTAFVGLLVNIAIWVGARYFPNLPVDIIKAIGAFVEMALIAWAGYSSGVKVERARSLRVK